MQCIYRTYSLLTILQISCAIAQLWKIFYRQSERKWTLVYSFQTLPLHLLLLYIHTCSVAILGVCVLQGTLFNDLLLTTFCCVCAHVQEAQVFFKFAVIKITWHIGRSKSFFLCRSWRHPHLWQWHESESWTWKYSLFYVYLHVFIFLLIFELALCVTLLNHTELYVYSLKHWFYSS